MSITYRQFLGHLRKLAVAALSKYEIQDAKLKFINYSGNGLYRVDIPTSINADEPFVPGRYALKLHQPDYMTPEHINSEMEWLAALRGDGIAVPQPIQTTEGRWLTSVEGDHEFTKERNCTLLRWVNGRMLTKKVTPNHLRAVGRILAQMHEHARKWKRPKGFTRRHWDWEGFYGDGSGFVIPGEKVRSSIPKAHKKNFDHITERVREAMDGLGKGKRVYGLTHADVAIDGNVLFHGGKARPIDFDDSGFGYWISDLAVPLANYISDFKDNSRRMRVALFEGYEEVLEFPQDQLDYLDLFIAARYTQEMAWAQAGIIQYPHNKDEGMNWLNRAGKDLKRQLKIVS